MDKSRDLGVLLPKINSLYDLNINLIKKRKPKSVLHQTYDEKQIPLFLPSIGCNFSMVNSGL